MFIFFNILRLVRAKLLSAAALFVFLSASARAGVIRIDLLFLAFLRSAHRSIILVRSCHLGDFLSFYLQIGRAHV